MPNNIKTLTADAHRWKATHRFFFTQIQALLLAISAYERRPSKGKLDDISSLLVGSAVSMQLASDFLDEGYDWIRKDMAKVREDFSGIFSADHAELIKRLRVLRSAKESFPEAYERFGAVMTTLYKAHGCVCERFVDNGGSLANPQINAPELLQTKFLRKALVAAGAVERARRQDSKGPKDA